MKEKVSKFTYPALSHYLTMLHILSLHIMTGYSLNIQNSLINSITRKKKIGSKLPANMHVYSFVNNKIIYFKGLKFPEKLEIP